MTSIFIKELSDDAKNPRLINVPHEWPISRHSNCCDSASICVHDGFAYRKNRWISHSHTSPLQARLSIDKRWRSLVHLPLLRKSVGLKVVQYRENKIMDCERRGIRCH